MNDKHIRDRLSSFCVGIAGCGGLGSNGAMALARVGLGTLVIVDFDKVELSNLNRQYYFRHQIGRFKVDALQENIAKVDPSLKVVSHVLKLTPENIPAVFSGCDVVVEAFDLADQKQMIIETILESMPSTPLVTGLGMAGWGESDRIRTDQYQNLYICGDQTIEVSEDIPPLAPRVGMVAALQANTVMEILLGKM